MKDINAEAGAASSVPGMELVSMWDVAAGATYAVERMPPETSMLLAVRTLAGSGILTTARGCYELRQESLIVLDNANVKRYRANGTWRFHWFLFRLTGQLPLPPETVIEIPLDQAEEEHVSHIATLLRRPISADAQLASCLFNAHIHALFRRRVTQIRNRPHQQTIETLIDTMHLRIAPAWMVAEMAVYCGMSERLFRNVFRDITGRSPKTFYDSLRLQHAAQFLSLGIYSVKQVAAKTGFSSEFHFSKSFNNHFGYPPSCHNHGSTDETYRPPPSTRTPRNACLPPAADW